MNTMKSKLKPIACVLLVLAVRAASAATLPSGFTESVIASGISSPTAMDFAPDGRLFICQQNGQLRVIKNDALLPTPFLTVTTDSSGERGLLGVAFDPDFANNQRVYIYYTVSGSPPHNRVSRFVASVSRTFASRHGMFASQPRPPPLTGTIQLILRWDGQPARFV